jgi:succinate-acetate transporter protein
MIAEWIMGNFLSMMIMGMFAVYWLSFGALQTPSMGIAASYSATGDAAQGALTVGYNAAIALYLMVWGFWLFTTFIFTLMTNVVLVLIFLFASLASFVLGAAYWKVSTAEFALAANLEKVCPASNYWRRKPTN